MNNTNLRRVDGGDVIKQGDSSSILAFELLDENNQPVNLSGQDAIVTFETYSRETHYRKLLQVEGENKISFTIDIPLAAITYNVEVTAGGYIFPSDHSMEVKVKKGHAEYAPPDELKKCTTEDDVIKLIKENGGGPVGPDGKSAYDLWLELGNEGTIEDFLSSLIGRDGKTAYDIWLEAGNVGSIDDFLQALKGEPGPQGNSAYQTWLDLGNTGTEQEFIDSLKPQIIRRAPIAYTLDRTTMPWTIWFDNGCGLQFPDYQSTETVYGYGFGEGGFISKNIVAYPLPVNLIRASNGSTSINNWKAAQNGLALYWANSAKIINPMQDATLFDFENAFYNSGDTNNLSLTRQKNVIRVMYELGIWSEEDILDLGAVKVGGE